MGLFSTAWSSCLWKTDRKSASLWYSSRTLTPVTKVLVSYRKVIFWFMPETSLSMVQSRKKTVFTGSQRFRTSTRYFLLAITIILENLVMDIAQLCVRPMFDLLIANYVVSKTHEESVRFILTIDVLQKTGTIYLRPDRPTVSVNIHDRRLVFHGLPYTTLSFGPNAFMRERTCLHKLWLEAPMSDIMVSHAPPWGILDQALDSRHLGCDGLRAVIEQIIPALWYATMCTRLAERNVDDTWTIVVNAAVMNRSKAIQWGAELIEIWSWDHPAGTVAVASSSNNANKQKIERCWRSTTSVVMLPLSGLIAAKLMSQAIIEHMPQKETIVRV